jgi:hypothetical protein
MRARIGTFLQVLQGIRLQVIESLMEKVVLPENDLQASRLLGLLR